MFYMTYDVVLTLFISAPAPYLSMDSICSLARMAAHSRRNFSVLD
ncbi:MAG: hypothetical protein ACK52J_02185 [bacterium]